MSGSDLCIPRNETAQLCYFQNGIMMFCLPISTFMYLWVIFIFTGSVCLFFCWQILEYINHSQIHECRKWELGRTVSLLGIHKLDFGYSVIYTRNSKLALYWNCLVKKTKPQFKNIVTLSLYCSSQYLYCISAKRWKIFSRRMDFIIFENTFVVFHHHLTKTR